jgi:hypothetical protein
VNQAWLSRTSGRTGSGDGAVAYTVAGHAGTETRTGLLLVEGEPHTVTQRLEAVAHTLRPGSSVTLQITSSATNYGLQRALGTVDFDRIDLRLPRAKLR